MASIVQFIRDLGDFTMDNMTATTPSDYVYGYTFAFERYDAYAWTDLARNNWNHAFTIVAVYYVLLYATHRLMANRQPFRLRRTFFRWNVALALLNGVGFLRFSEELSHNLVSRGVAYSLCHICNPHGPAAFWAMLIVILKFLEFGDSFLVLLRKQTLPFYVHFHHSTLFLGSLHSLLGHSAPSQAFAAMNTFAHTWLYGYLAASVVGRRRKWAAAVVTALQAAQMFTFLFVGVYVYRLKVYDGLPCQQSMIDLQFTFLICATLTSLYIPFVYRKTKHWRRPTVSAAEKTD